MITTRKSAERGVGRHGWLTTRHTFSFANYYDPKQMGFRDLRVINEDVVAPGRGFGQHRHDNMEIISIVMSGALAHRDSTGGEGVLRRGEVQHMSAGSGVAHSEFNASDSEPVHFFQIWIEPSELDITPGYTQKRFDEEQRHGRLTLLVSPEGREGSLRIHQDVDLYTTILAENQRVDHTIAAGRGVWIQISRGSVDVNDLTIEEGDGVAIENETSLIVTGRAPESELLLFDLR